MKRVVQWLLDTVAVLSLLLSGLILGVWTSHALPWGLHVNFSSLLTNTVTERLSISTGDNMLAVDRERYERNRIVGAAATDKSACTAFEKQFLAGQADITILRFKTYTGPLFVTDLAGYRCMVGTKTYYLIPYGLMLFVLILLPAWRWLPSLIRWIKCRFIIPPGHCKNCGYDLRATPDRCPECGAVPALERIERCQPPSESLL